MGRTLPAARIGGLMMAMIGTTSYPIEPKPPLDMPRSNIADKAKATNHGSAIMNDVRGGRRRIEPVFRSAW